MYRYICNYLWLKFHSKCMESCTSSMAYKKHILALCVCLCINIEVAVDNAEASGKTKC